MSSMSCPPAWFIIPKYTSDPVIPLLLNFHKSLQPLGESPNLGKHFKMRMHWANCKMPAKDQPNLTSFLSYPFCTLTLQSRSVVLELGWALELPDHLGSFKNNTADWAQLSELLISLSRWDLEIDRYIKVRTIVNWFKWPRLIDFHAIPFQHFLVSRLYFCWSSS